MGNDDSKEKVFECFDFLRALACKNEEVKIRSVQNIIQWKSEAYYNSWSAFHWLDFVCIYICDSTFNI